MRYELSVHHAFLQHYNALHDSASVLQASLGL
jgi:hypothetical protein